MDMWPACPQLLRSTTPGCLNLIHPLAPPVSLPAGDGSIGGEGVEGLLHEVEEHLQIGGIARLSAGRVLHPPAPFHPATVPFFRPDPQREQVRAWLVSV